MPDAGVLTQCWGCWSRVQLNISKSTGLECQDLRMSEMFHLSIMPAFLQSSKNCLEKGVLSVALIATSF